MNIINTLVPNPDFALLLHEYGLSRGETLRRMIGYAKVCGISKCNLQPSPTTPSRVCMRCNGSAHIKTGLLFKRTFARCQCSWCRLHVDVRTVFRSQATWRTLFIDGSSVCHFRCLSSRWNSFLEFIVKQTYRVNDFRDYCIACFSARSYDHWYRKHTHLTIHIPEINNILVIFVWNRKSTKSSSHLVTQVQWSSFQNSYRVSTHVCNSHTKSL